MFGSAFISETASVSPVKGQKRRLGFATNHDFMQLFFHGLERKTRKVVEVGGLKIVPDGYIYGALRKDARRTSMRILQTFGKRDTIRACVGRWPLAVGRWPLAVGCCAERGRTFDYGL